VIAHLTRPPATQGDPHDILIPPPPPEKIYELHNDYLGSPRYITHGSKPPSLLPRGEMAGEQAFGPYGERMDGNFVVGGMPSAPILKDLPWGYKPITGYTGHVNEDLTGLIYMRGRYYSPAWHRFVSSDQGVDPLSINQFAYVGGMPFMAKDPTGMIMRANKLAEMPQLFAMLWDQYIFFTSPQYTKVLAMMANIPRLCKKLAAEGWTKERYEMAKFVTVLQVVNELQRPGPDVTINEFGFSYFHDRYHGASPSTDPEDIWSVKSGIWAGVTVNIGLSVKDPPDNSPGILVHTHFWGAPLSNVEWPWLVSDRDTKFASKWSNGQHYAVWSGGVMRYDASGVIWSIVDRSWWIPPAEKDCGQWLPSEKDIE
jgi:RHS repeat-associated protein